MARDERQDIGKLVKIKRIAGSDLPKRDAGIKSESETKIKRDEPKRWPGYTGRHRG